MPVMSILVDGTNVSVSISLASLSSLIGILLGSFGSLALRRGSGYCTGFKLRLISTMEFPSQLNIQPWINNQSLRNFASRASFCERVNNFPLSVYGPFLVQLCNLEPPNELKRGFIGDKRGAKYPPSLLTVKKELELTIFNQMSLFQS